jgi:Leucine-rich repeat (LRR) protein
MFSNTIEKRRPFLHERVGRGSKIRPHMLPVAILLLTAGMTRAGTPKAESDQHQQAITALKNLGATVKTVQTGNIAGTFVSIYESSFGPKWKGGIDGLKHLKALANLQSLAIDDSHLTDEGLQHLQGLKNLKTLRLTGKFTDSSLKYLKGSTNLEALYLVGDNITETGLAHVHTESLLRLELTGSQVTELDLGRFPKLQNLLLGSTKLKAIRSKNVHNLKTLSLAYCPITDTGLADLPKLTRLEDLDLSKTAITNTGLARIKDCPDLKILDLRGATGWTDAGLVHLKGLTRLEILRLSETTVTDEGLKHLQAVKSLLRLELDRTQVTDAGLEHLKGLPNLVFVSYYLTKITPEGAHKLKKALPKLVHP